MSTCDEASIASSGINAYSIHFNLATSESKRGVVIVIRGPAGVGKSTISAAVKQKLLSEEGRTVAYIEQDLFRSHVANNNRAISGKLMFNSALTCIDSGMDYVMVEGILNAFQKDYRETLFDPLRSVLGDAKVKFFYLDASLSLTQERHQTREKSGIFGGEKLVEWFSSSGPTGYPSEVVIDAAQHTIDEVVDIIVSHI